MLPRNNSSNPKQVKFKFMMNFNAMKCRNKARATSAAQNRFVSQQTKGKRAAHVGQICTRSAICMCRLIHTCNPCRREQRIIILKFLFLFFFFERWQEEKCYQEIIFSLLYKLNLNLLRYNQFIIISEDIFNIIISTQSTQWEDHLQQIDYSIRIVSEVVRVRVSFVHFIFNLERR